MKAFALFTHEGSELTHTPQKRGKIRQRPPLKGGSQSTSSSTTVGRAEIMVLLRNQRPDYTEKKLEVRMDFVFVFVFVQVPKT